MRYKVREVRFFSLFIRADDQAAVSFLRHAAAGQARDSSSRL